MKVNYSDKKLKEFFESLDKDFLKKVYDDAVVSTETKKSAKIEAVK